MPGVGGSGIDVDMPETLHHPGNVFSPASRIIEVLECEDKLSRRPMDTGQVGRPNLELILDASGCVGTGKPVPGKTSLMFKIMVR